LQAGARSGPEVTGRLEFSVSWTRVPGVPDRRGAAGAAHPAWNQPRCSRLG